MKLYVNEGFSFIGKYYQKVVSVNGGKYLLLNDIFLVPWQVISKNNFHFPRFPPFEWGKKSVSHIVNKLW